MKFHVFPLLRLAALLGAASGLMVGPVRLVKNRSYISYRHGASPNNSLIECPYQLEEEGEHVQRVLWEMWEDVYKLGTYEWHPSSGGNATGRLKGMVNLNRDDGSLELIKLRYDLAGEYSCGVSLTNGETKNAAKEEVLIVDLNGRHNLNQRDMNCSFIGGYVSPAVFPEATLRAGMFSRKLDEFYDEVPNLAWRKVIHSNSSVTYSFNNVSFKIDQNTPDDVVFKVEIGIIKSDGEYISQGSITSYSSSWNENGCPDVKEEDSKQVKYSANSFACRGGRRNYAKATVTCKEGYQGEWGVSLVRVRCHSTSLTWEPEQGHTATLKDLVCVEDTGTDGGASSGYPSYVLLLASLLGVVVLLFSFSRA